MKIKALLLNVVKLIAVGAVLFWFMLPPINVQDPAFYMWLCITFGIVGVLNMLIFDRKDYNAYDTGFNKTSWGGVFEFIFRKKRNQKPGLHVSAITIAVGFFLLILIFNGLSYSLFHAKTYASRLVPVDGEVTELPTSDDADHISLMDTDSARILGNRVIGSLTDVVSQFEVADDHYNTLVSHDKIIKVVPLDYGGFFKYFNNKANGTPGYVLVDTQSFDATFVRLTDGLRYTPNGYFFHNLERHIRLMHPTAITSDSRFEIDEDGKPYWITTVYGRKFLFGGDVVKGAIITDPSSGASTYYKLADIPEWVDIVFTGRFTAALYDDYGMLRNGWLNSVISQKGCLKTTDDFGYLAKGNDVYIYTGITSVVTDESNLGFIMVNARTGDCTYVACAGAEEYSAMSAAQGAVQNYGYSASFPSLVTVDGVPTYVMVLKDSAGLIKDYAAVNVANYTIVSIGTSLDDALKAYRTRLSLDTSGAASDTGETETETIVIDRIAMAVIDGNTWAYLMTADDTIFKMPVSQDETVVSLESGDKVEVTYPAVQKEADVIMIAEMVRK